MGEPVILSLSPRALVEPIHDRLRGALAPHELRFPTGRAALVEDVGSADLLLGDWTHETKVSADVLAAANRCRIIVQPTAGYDTIDVISARSLGIPVVNAPGANARAVAEWAVMAILSSLKNAVLNHDRTRRGEWCMAEAADEGVFELGGRTVGILGFGQIGQGVARRLAGFDVASILYLDAHVSIDEVAPGVPVERVTDVDELCRRSDVLSVHVPLMPETHHLINAQRLALLGPEGVLVNTSRGAVVDEAALLSSLQSGLIKAAALDVFADEPLVGPHRWSDVSNVLLSPHISGGTIEARDAMFSRALSSLNLALAGELPHPVVNGVNALRI